MPLAPIQINQQSDPRARFALRVAAVALICILIGWLSAIARTSDQVILISLGILGTAILSVPILFNKRFDIFEPITAVFFLFLFGAPLKLCYVAMVADTNSYVRERLLNDGPLSALIPGVMLAIAGLTFLVIGYMLPAHKRAVPFLLFPSLHRLDPKKLQLICLAIFAFSCVCFCLFVITAGVSLSDISSKRFSSEEGAHAGRLFSYKYYLYRLAGFAKFTAYLSFAWLLFNRKTLRNWFGLLCIASAIQTMLVCVIISNRAGIVLMILDFILIAYFVRGRRMNMLKVGVVAFAASIGVIGVLAARASEQRGLSEIVEKTMAGRDMMDITKTAHIINAVPHKIEYRNGEMLYAWATAFIPRSVWPDKPMWIERGPYIMQNVFNSKNKIGGVPPGYIAELYWNFGWVGLFIGMLLFGYFTKLFYLSYLNVELNPVSAILYTFFVTRFVLFSLGNDLGTGVIKLGLDLVPLLIILVACQKPKECLPYGNDYDSEIRQASLAQMKPNQDVLSLKELNA